MDPNLKVQSLVETFDQVNSNSIPEYIVALITLLTYPVSTCTAERSFSGTERLQTPLQMTTDYRSEIEFSCNSAFEHKDVIDFDGIIKGFAYLKGTHLALCL